MKLSLSTAAVPGMALDALEVAYRARGLDGVELVIANGDDASALAGRVRMAGLRVVALRIDAYTGDTSFDRLGRLSKELAAPLSLPATSVASGALPKLVRSFSDAGGTLLFGFDTDLDQVVALADRLRETFDPACVGLAWEVRPSSKALGASSAVLLAALEQLRLVRLHGGGPEQHDQDGKGVGALFVDLALAGFGGAIVLTPSRSAEVPRWGKWLASRKIGGCGSAHPSGESELDVRYVEPKDRLSTILGAFHALAPGATLRVTVDHDPSCMYYALEATEPAGTFAFRKLGDGPEVWHAEVTKTVVSSKTAS